MSKYVRGRVNESLNLGTLAAVTSVSDTWDEAMVEAGRITSVIATWALEGFTEGAAIGPIMVGVAHSDYTDGEIDEYIETTGSWDVGDKVQQERANRKIRIVGVFPTSPGSSAAGSSVLNDGKPIKTKLNWFLTTGDTLKMWAYNTGGSPVATTTPILKLNGHANIFLD